MLLPLASARLSLKKGTVPSPSTCASLHQQIVEYENSRGCSLRFQPLQIVEHARTEPEQPRVQPPMAILRAARICRHLKSDFGCGARRMRRLIVRNDFDMERDAFHPGDGYLWADTYFNMLCTSAGEMKRDAIGAMVFYLQVPISTHRAVDV
eukprot:9113818-Pyramimonas_sp.AAC.1